MQQKVPVVVVGNKDVRKSVAVVIGDCDPHSFTQQLARTCLQDLCKSPVAVVVIKQNRLSPILVRVAIGTVRTVEAATKRIVARGPVAVIRDDEVKMAIVVVIEPGCGD